MISRPRNRLVYFRVSEEEYEQFTGVCELTGSRSVSDLARQAIQTLLKDRSNGQDQLSQKLTRLEAMVGDLDQKVIRLSMSLAQSGFLALSLKPEMSEKEERS